jgi:hypothetical protein
MDASPGKEKAHRAPDPKRAGKVDVKEAPTSES